MANHPNRATQKPFIAFSMVSYHSLAYANTAAEARDMAVKHNKLDDDAFIEVLACGENGVKVWAEALPLFKARAKNKTVFRGDGLAKDLPPVALEG